MKRRLLKNLICFAICCDLIAGLFSDSFLNVFAVSEETQNAIDQAEDEKEQLEQELEQQEVKKENLEDRKAGEEQKLQDLKKQYQALASDLAALDEKKQEKEAEIGVKEQELEAAVQIRDKQYEDMKLRIQYMYEKPEISWISIFFKSFSIAELLNRVDTTLQIQEYDREQLEEFTEVSEEIAKQKESLEGAKAELENLIKEAQHKQTQVSALQKETSASISEYLAQIASAEEEIGNTEDALEAKTEALLQLYEKAQAEEAAERRRQAEEAAKRLQEAIANGEIVLDDSGIVWREISLSEAEMEMLTAMIYCESRGEPYEGQLAVGYVIMNRIRSSKFPNTLEEVLRQGRQFEPAGSGRFDIVLTAYREGIPGVISQSEWDSCAQAARECVNGTSNVAECLFFRTHAPVPQLAENLEAAGVPYWIIQNHIFYYSWVNY